jgi:hypothetical protein
MVAFIIRKFLAQFVSCQSFHFKSDWLHATSSKVEYGTTLPIVRIDVGPVLCSM